MTTPNTTPRTLFEKVWQPHLVAEPAGEPTILYIDLHLVHEVTSPQAFDGLRVAGRKLRRPDRTIATVDHNVPTTSVQIASSSQTRSPHAQVAALRKNCADFGIEFFDVQDRRPGHRTHDRARAWRSPSRACTIVCGDSHTATHGAFGALAFGIGTSEVEHVMATQTLPQSPAKDLPHQCRGRPALGVTAKDIILDIIGRSAPTAPRATSSNTPAPPSARLSMEGRMTVCNMTIEAGARAGMIAPDEKTFAYLKAGASPRRCLERGQSPTGQPSPRPKAPSSTANSPSTPPRSRRPSPGAPRRAWSPPSTCTVPYPRRRQTDADRKNFERAYEYMGAEARHADRATSTSTPSSSAPAPTAASKTFAPPPTSSRATTSRPRSAPWSCPARRRSRRRPKQKASTASSKSAGFEWREPGCSMCLAMNPDILQPGERCASTSNRNFEGRQGRGGRTHLVSPQMAAAAAITGHFTDIRTWKGYRTRRTRRRSS